MKRFRMLLLAALMLLCSTACQPTPAQEYVVNKKDSNVEQKLRDDARQTAQTLPERWDELYEGDLLTLTFNAPIVQKADGLYPVYRTRPDPLTEEQIIRYLSVLFPNPVTVRQNRPTKADIQKEMEWYLKEAEAKLAWQDAGRPDDGVDRDETPLTREEVNEELANYQKLINEAPDRNEESPVTAYRVPVSGEEGQLVFGLKSGESVIVSPSWNGSLYAGLGASFSNVYRRYDYEFEKQYEDEEDLLPYTPVTADKTKCELRAKEALTKMGIEGMVLAESEEANLMDGRMCLSGGYECLFVRDFGGYPYLGSNFEPCQHLSYGSDESFAANKYIRHEELRLFADEEGVKLISFDSPKMIVGIESKNIDLLPFDQAQDRIKQGLTYGLAKWAQDMQVNDPGKKMNVEIYELALTTYTLHVPNSEDYYEMPCYVVYFDEWERPTSAREDKSMMQDTLLINAVDGSIVHTAYGW